MKKFVLGLGVIAIAEGVWTLMGGKVFMKTGGGWINQSNNFGYIMISIGILLLLISKFFIKTQFKKDKYAKCPKCKEVFAYNQLIDGACSNCNITTIDMKEYFKIYPNDEIAKE